jgi:hypothetical protein
MMEALMIVAVRASETSVYFNETTRRYIPEGCHLHTSRRENLKMTYVGYVRKIKTGHPKQLLDEELNRHTIT